MRILITNDDGINSEGLRALAETLEKRGEVFVVAPDRERSAVSHSLTLHRPLRYEKIKKNFYAVDGTPTDCVYLAVNKLLKERPHIVVSGINKGGNFGDDITYSGTVSAAVEATLLKIPAFAISLAAKKDFKFRGAAQFATRLVEYILKNGMPKDTFLNVNIPNVNPEEIKSHMITKLGKRIYGSGIVEKVDPRGGKYFWIGTDGLGFEDLEGTDYYAIKRNFISITPIHLDLNNYSAMEELRQWKL